MAESKILAKVMRLLKEDGVELNVANAIEKLLGIAPKTMAYTIPIFQCGSYNGFTYQPSNDGVTVVSSSASDVGKITFFGVQQTTNKLVYETVTLNGTTAVNTTRTDWLAIRGAFLGTVDGKESTRAVGTITIKKLTGAQSITTIAVGNRSVGTMMFVLSGLLCTLDTLTGNTFAKEITSNTATSIIDGILPANYTTVVDNAVTLTTGKMIDLKPTYALAVGSDTIGGTAQIIVWSVV